MHVANMISLTTILLLSCHLFGNSASLTENSEIDPSKTQLWGPGLQPEKVTMRARYIFLQLHDKTGKNITRSPGNGVVSAVIKGLNEDNRDCYIKTQVLDCNDGSFIIRYKVHNTCFNVRLNVKVNGQDVLMENNIFPGPVYEEECYCPNPSIEAWRIDNECSKSYPQIRTDLKPFPVVDFQEIRKDIIKEYNRPNSVSICHYIIKNNKIYRQCYGQHVGFKTFMDSILLSLARKTVLPDVEFFMNLGDWPLAPRNKKLYPIFSWCGSNDTWDIVVPTYDITGSALESMGRVMLDMLSVQGNTRIPWEEKIEKLFWRGRDSSPERLILIDIARKYPELINASITNFFFYKDKIDKYGPGVRPISFFTFFEHKYQLNLDGTVAAYRFPYLLAGDSVVLKQESKYYEYFYNHLVAGKHYIPVKRDLSNLVEKIVWAKKFDEEARKIAKAGRSLVRDLALPHHVFCYHVALLHEWSKRLKSEVKVFPDMEEVPQPENSCKCNRHFNSGFNSAKDEL